MGGNWSHEFMVLADAGEDGIVECDKCSYAANLERAESVIRTPAVVFEAESKPVETVATPNRRTIEEVTAFLKVPAAQLIKTLIYKADDQPVVILLPGDREVNEIKVRRHLKAKTLELADNETIKQVTGAPVGFAGPIGLKVPVHADLKLKGYKGAITGANQADAHFLHVDLERDAQVKEYADLTMSKDGDGCPRCGGALHAKRGIEVGHVFKLGTKYSELLGAKYLSTDGQQKPCVMGCYGIGVTRTLQSVIEQSHDEQGIVWPISVAPYAVEVVNLNMQSAECVRVADELIRALEAKGVEVLYDDRDERPGVKFKDADLLGLPVRVNIGERSLAKGIIEYKIRKLPDLKTAPIAEAAAVLLGVIDELRKEVAVCGASQRDAE
ncbi:MAG: proline--tRNA ligase, partial [Lentisphaerota bacterium]